MTSACIISIGTRKKRIMENCLNLTKNITNIMVIWIRVIKRRPARSFFKVSIILIYMCEIN